jgi:hypothetical protein
VPDEIRRVEFYRDAAGRCDVDRELERLTREDRRAVRAITSKIDILKQVSLDRTIASGLVKKAASNIYVLRVQSGPVSYRLPFFEAPGDPRTLVVVTHCVHRAILRRDRYQRLIEDAVKRRADWIRRNVKGGAR